MTPQRLQHVPALDGLRAIAVLAVVIFHLDFTGLPGGFVGVDVFFVLSGYLMMRIVIDSTLDGSYSFFGFLWRRFKRLAPALLAMTSIVLVAASMIYMPTDFKAIMESGIAANFYLSNIYFWFTLDYFDSAAAFAPFLHTWSLGVEGQFYLALPVGLLVLSAFGMSDPRKKTFFACLAAITLGSFALNIVLVDWLQKTTGGFYFPATRFWEMLLGCLAALLPLHVSYRLKRPELLAWTGLAFVLVPMFLLSEQSTFPGINALFPCIGAVLIIASIMHHQTYFSRLLCTESMQFLGRISYSLYLWHWPTIVIYKYWSMRPLGIQDGLLVFAISIALATLSYVLIEKPFRKPWKLVIPGWRGLFVASIPLIALFFSSGVADTRNIQLKSAYPGYFSYFNESYEEKVAASYNDGNCFLRFVAKPPMSSNCLKQSNEKQNILLIGDSHAAHLLPGLKRHFPFARIMQANVAGCRALVDRITANGPMCDHLQKILYKGVLLDQKPDLVVLAGRWNRDDLPSLDRTLKFLNRKGHNSILVGPVIEYLDTVPSLLVRNNVGLNANAGVLDTMRDNHVLKLEQPVKELAFKNGVQYFSSQVAVCPNNRCDIFADLGIPYQWDYGHYTPEGSIAVVGNFKNKLIAALNNKTGARLAFEDIGLRGILQ